MNYTRGGNAPSSAADRVVVPAAVSYIQELGLLGILWNLWRYLPGLQMGRLHERRILHGGLSALSCRGSGASSVEVGLVGEQGRAGRENIAINFEMDKWKRLKLQHN